MPDVRTGVETANEPDFPNLRAARERSVPHRRLDRGLALIFGVLLWRAASSRTWHFTAAAIHLLLGTCNLVFWEFFVSTGSLATGYVTTGLHWLFVALQLACAATLGKGDSPLYSQRKLVA